MNEIAVSFTVIDYAIFAFSLLLALITGIYFAVKDRNVKSTDAYFYGNGQMSPLPVGLSLAVSCVSALTIMGYPVEVYLFGTVWFWLMLCFPLVILTTSKYYIPIYCDLKLKCVYEYLELRFNKPVRLICSVFALCYSIFYMATATFYPSLSLTTVTPISVEWSIAITVTLCTVYTVIGGFKSVIWTDSIQAVIMVGGCMALLIHLVIDVGGISQILTAVNRGNRSTIDTFTLSPFKRCSMWSVFLLGFCDWLIIMATNQQYVQRYVSCNTPQRAQRSLYISMLPQMIVTFLSISMGMALYTLYEGCDPVKSGEIEDINQLLPYTVAKVTRALPGLSGLFVATVYSGTLSTISSGINSVSVIIMEDFVSLKWTFTEQKKLTVSKICGICVGITVLCLAYITTLLSGTVVEISSAISSAFGSAMLGIFTLGIFIPWSNSTGTIIGACAGFSVNIWLSVGALVTNHMSQELPVSTELCNSTWSNTTFNVGLPAPNEPPSPYDVSFMYTRFYALLITIPVGVIMSFLTGANDPKMMNPKLFMPILDNKLLPRKLVRFLRFGVPEKITNEEEELSKLNPMM